MREHPNSEISARRRDAARLLAALAVSCLAFLAYGPTTALAASHHRHDAHGHRNRHHSHARRSARHRRRSGGRTLNTRRSQRFAPRIQRSSVAPLVFGIYPGGAAGTVGPSGPLQPEDPVKRLAALEQLRAPGEPFVLHLYAGYTGPGGYSAQQQVGNDIAAYTATGFQIELVLTYRPADGGSPQDVNGFVAFTRAALAAFGSNPNFVSLQVTNETNVANAPNASDGYYAGAEDALIDGVIAAHSAITQSGWSQVKVGFNWAAAGTVNEHAFWSYLGSHGGKSFVQALDWVGLDAYPGTWGPPIKGSLTQGTKTALNSSFSALRNQYMPLAGIPSRVAIHVSESGYPTGPGRTPAMQVQALQAAVAAVAAGQAKYNITDYRWFDLRDADSASGSFEDQYGLMTDTYTPKPAFAAYHQLVASLGKSSSARASALRRLQRSLRRS